MLKRIKLKTCKSASKRFKQLKSSYKRKKAFKSHNMLQKSSSQVCNLSRYAVAHKHDLKLLIPLLPYKA